MIITTNYVREIDIITSNNSHSLREPSKCVKAKHPPWTPV